MRIEYVIVSIVLLVVVLMVVIGIITGVIPGFEDFLNQLANRSGELWKQ